MFLLGFGVAMPKKIKQSLKVKKETAVNPVTGEDYIPGKKIDLSENNSLVEPDSISGKYIGQLRFSGYEKEINSKKESFLISNNSHDLIHGLKVRIVYLDMNGRMFHSRETSNKCNLPQGETRKIDIPSWDNQNTYFYYLGNEPKKVATPFKVEIIPLAVWIEE